MTFISAKIDEIMCFLFINYNVKFFIHCKCLLFSDHLKNLFVIRNVYDCKLLKEDLIRFQDCCYKNCMELDVSKCFHIRFTRKKRDYNCDNVYTLSDQTVTKVDTDSDLEVTFNSNINVDTHANIVVTILVNY